MNPMAIKKSLEIAGAVVSTALTVITVIIKAKENRGV